MARGPKISGPGSLTAEDVYARLELRYALPEWGLFRQVCEAGTGGNRYADALAFNLFPSRGLEIHGLEIKVSRGDWLREKRDPAKADVLARFCDRWWVVAGAPDIVMLDELPPTWGLIIPRGDGLVAKVDAPKLQGDQPTRALLATVIRRMKADDRYSWDAEIVRAVREETKRLTADHEKAMSKELAPLRAFESAAGISIGHLEWGPHKPSDVGLALRLFLDGKLQVDRVREELERLRRSLSRQVETLDETLGPVEATVEDVT